MWWDSLGGMIAGTGGGGVSTFLTVALLRWLTVFLSWLQTGQRERDVDCGGGHVQVGVCQTPEELRRPRWPGEADSFVDPLVLGASVRGSGLGSSRTLTHFPKRRRAKYTAGPRSLLADPLPAAWRVNNGADVTRLTKFDWTDDDNNNINVPLVACLLF